MILKMSIAIVYIFVSSLFTQLQAEDSSVCNDIQKENIFNLQLNETHICCPVLREKYGYCNSPEYEVFILISEMDETGSEFDIKKAYHEDEKDKRRKAQENAREYSKLFDEFKNKQTDLDEISLERSRKIKSVHEETIRKQREKLAQLEEQRKTAIEQNKKSGAKSSGFLDVLGSVLVGAYLGKGLSDGTINTQTINQTMNTITNMNSGSNSSTTTSINNSNVAVPFSTNSVSNQNDYTNASMFTPKEPIGDNQDYSNEFMPGGSFSQGNCSEQEDEINTKILEYKSQAQGKSSCQIARLTKAAMPVIHEFYTRCPINDPTGEMTQWSKDTMDWAIHAEQAVCSDM